MVRSLGVIMKTSRLSAIFFTLTVVSLGSSIPEIFISFSAISRGETDIMAGIVTGSNMFNIMIILGICTLIKEIKLKRFVFVNEILFLNLSALGLLGSLYSLTLGKHHGILMIASFVLFFLLTFALQSNTKRRIGYVISLKRLPIIGDSFMLNFLIFVVLLITALYINFLILSMLGQFSIPLFANQYLFSKYILSIITSLPEIILCLLAIKRKFFDIILGTILGSNIVNILLITGLSSYISPQNIFNTFVFEDVLILGATGLVITVPMIISQKISRWFGLLLFVIYFGIIFMDLK